MKIRHAACTAALIACSQFLGAGLAFAVDPTPTATATPSATGTPSGTPSATPTPSGTATPTPVACVSFQDCVDTSVPAAVNTCATENPSCTISSQGTYALTPGILAQRAIAEKNCASRKTKFSCRACYESAKIPLAARFDVHLFDYLVATAVKDITALETTNCNALKH